MSGKRTRFLKDVVPTLAVYLDRFHRSEKYEIVFTKENVPPIVELLKILKRHKHIKDYTAFGKRRIVFYDCQNVKHELKEGFVLTCVTMRPPGAIAEGVAVDYWFGVSPLSECSRIQAEILKTLLPLPEGYGSATE